MEHLRTVPHHQPGLGAFLASWVCGLLCGLALAACSGCGKVEDSQPAASSSMTRADAQRLADLWVTMKPGNVVASVLKTGSMTPTLDSRSLLLLERVTFSELQTGDILYTGRITSDTPLLHRLRAKYKNEVVLRGDNNSRNDPPIDASRIQYRVAGLIYTKRQ